MTAYRSILLTILGLAALPLVAPALVGAGIFAGANTLYNLMVFVLIIALAAQGWNLAGGYGGQFSFGHAAFFGTGAYAQAILQTRYGVNAWAALVAAVAFGAAIGVVIGFLAFRARLRGSYFALVTLAFAEVFRILANAAPITGGAAGTLVKLDVGWTNLQFASREAFYYLALAFVALVLLLNRLIERSRFGTYLVAVRENEDAARALGVDTLKVKLRAITLSAAITALAGALYTQKFLYVDANIAYGAWISVEALLAPIVGGIATVFGPLVGALTLIGLGEAAKVAIHALLGSNVPGVDLVVYGVLLILIIAFAPRGVIGLLDRRAR